MNETQTITLSVTDRYASQLDLVIREYRNDRARRRHFHWSEPVARWYAWQAVAQHVEWSIADDAAHGNYTPADVAAHIKIRARMAALAKRFGDRPAS